MKTMILTTLVLLLAGALPVEARKQASKPCLIVQGRDGGMFNSFDDVLGAIDLYTTANVSGLVIDFETDGYYYDPNFGSNWWSYFCRPIQLGQRKARVIKTPLPGYLKNFRHPEYSSLPRAYWGALTNRHISLQPIIQQKVNAFIAHEFTGFFVIGIHYRGTDKNTEAPRVSYENALEAVEQQIALLGNTPYHIFVATDEWAFIDYIATAFPGRICYYQDMPRSADGQPIHMNTSYSGYERGESAIMDCVLLSKCDFLIRCSSNLSRWSTYFNPDLPVIELNQRRPVILTEEEAAQLEENE